ncbi:hypothetical protein ACHAC9_22850 [Massilia sp. CMS3.1]|uniref:hypothetical protein n=1 Tax=Massilia sp. CMS3.1 TaxID=3373083 RepID=UPI003EE6DE12
MKKISEEDEKKIVRLITKWPHSKSMTWEDIREQIAADSNSLLPDIWSRQSLSANSRISEAYRNAKSPVEPTVNPEYEALTNKIKILELQIIDANSRYDRLLLRHTQLAYSASLLEDGLALLDTPLPDNTQSQR